MRPLLGLFVFLASFHALAAGRDVAPRPIVPAVATGFGSSIAFAADRFLSVWVFSPDYSTMSIVGALSDANGRRISPSWFPVVTDARASSVSVFGTGDSFTLFWHDQSFPSTTLRMAELDGNGAITARGITDLPLDRVLAWNGTHFLGTSGADRIVFDREGKVLRRVFGSGATLAAAASGDGFLVVLQGGVNALNFQRVSATAVSPLGFMPLVTNGPVFVAPADGDQLLVASSIAQRPSRVNVALVRLDGNVVRSRVISSGPADSFPLDFVRTTDGYRLTYAERIRIDHFILWAQELDSEGAPRGDRMKIGEAPPTNVVAASSDRVSDPDTDDRRAACHDPGDERWARRRPRGDLCRTCAADKPRRGPQD